MKSSQKIIMAGLLALAGAAVVGLVLTSNIPESQGKAQKPQRVHANQQPLTDEQLLATAQRLAPLAVTSDEQELAQDATRLADHEVDLAFAGALRTASQQSAPSSREARALEQRVVETKAAISAGQAKINRLKAEAAQAKNQKLAVIESQMELAQAELNLDQDELADAQQDLARSGGDAYAQIQQLWQQHEESQHKQATGASYAGSSSAASNASFHGGLITRYQAWSALHTQQRQLLYALANTLRMSQAISGQHQAIEQSVQAAQSRKDQEAQEATGIPPTNKPKAVGANPDTDAAARMSLLRNLSQDEKNLADLDKRILDLRQLSSVYGQWIGMVQARERVFLHAIVQSFLWILLAIVVVCLVGRLIDHGLARLKLDRKQTATLRTITHFTLNALAAVVILVVIFGSPSNMSTIIGLAGAGLTVALKDFIVSFFGWFVLMGRRGIHIGDWVEINGVRGEVIEISLMRTVLLETGNWNEPGHPTGRQVSFLNSYAVEGYYFNFTTSGQWLWDEIQLLIPWSVDPYPIIAKIEEVVKEHTEEEAETAEQEWQRAAHGYSVKTFSAAPSINLKSTDDGVEVTLHYICSVTKRYQLRSRLSHAAVKLIHEGKLTASATGPAPQSSRADSPTVQPVPAAET